MAVFLVCIEIVEQKISSFHLIVQVINYSRFFVDFDAETTTCEAIIFVIIIALIQSVHTATATSWLVKLLQDDLFSFINLSRFCIPLHCP